MIPVLCASFISPSQLWLMRHISNKIVNVEMNVKINIEEFNESSLEVDKDVYMK